MDGNITKDGIRKDLLWMHSIGVAGYHQFDAGGAGTEQIVTDRVPYMSGEWKDCFRYALQITDSLGMEAGVASSPGWSSTGGPWVSPENAMKKLVWRSVETEGGRQLLQLPDPFTAVGRFQDIAGSTDVEPWYRDIAAVAVRLPDQDRSLGDMGAAVSASGGDFSLEMLTDGRLSTYSTIKPDADNAWIRYDFPEKATFRGVTVAGEALRTR